MPWLWAFLFTQAVEMPIYMLGLRVRPIEAFGASALTHPIVWFVIPPLFERIYLALLAPHPSLRLAQGPRYWTMVVIAEAFAIGAEALYMRAIGREKTLRWSFAANLASVTLGLICRSLFGYP
ncbi:hypothetical protein [Polyangium aurulentum]|uniref:hypothetical protein n=1 Tax=Polyangium aurulentum TaxID=2567896 RepID=UPI0010AE4BC8|nr:hypothetical protein [Polyangium aurulentum]UQA62699.1 hypothetical protein E8A73_020480 [Polyangium aurulentum]